jgi:uncharacterized SAM-binding protein YcdF (DUF218 family)
LLGAAALAALLVTAFTPLANILSNALAIRPGVAPADAVVVLGSSVLPNGVLSSNSLRRTIEGIRLYRHGYAPVLVLLGGGGNGGPLTEAGARVLLARELGVPAAAIVTAAGWTTREEAAAVAAALASRGARSILLVTESHHLVRAQPLFEQAGFRVLPAPSDPARHARHPDERIGLMGDLLLEAAGRVYYRLAGYQ